jgi:hypothetical protein
MEYFSRVMRIGKKDEHTNNHMEGRVKSECIRTKVDAKILSSLNLKGQAV